MVGLLAFGLIPGPRELLLVMVVVLLLYGRSGSRLLMATPYGRRFAPWINLAQRVAPRPARPAPVRARRFWLPRTWWSWALVLAGLGIASAWVALRISVHNAVLSH